MTSCDFNASDFNASRYPLKTAGVFLAMAANRKVFYHRAACLISEIHHYAKWLAVGEHHDYPCPMESDSSDELLVMLDFQGYFIKSRFNHCDVFWKHLVNNTFVICRYSYAYSDFLDKTSVESLRT